MRNYGSVAVKKRIALLAKLDENFIVADAQKLLAQGRIGAAIRLLKPNPLLSSEIALLYFELLEKSGAIEESFTLAKQAIPIFGTDPNLRSVLSRIFAIAQAGDLLDPLYPEPRSAADLLELAQRFHQAGDLDRAKTLNQEAVSRLPQSSTAWSNLASILHDLNDKKAALNAYSRALDLSPASAADRLNRGLCHLSLGNWSQGFDDFEARLELPQAGLRWQDLPRWGGEAMEEQPLLIWADQGFGDCLHFLRFVPDALVLCPSIVLEVRPELLSLLKNWHPQVQVIARGQDIPSTVQAQCPLLSLPHILKLQGLAGQCPPYLTAPTIDSHWQNLMAGPGRKIGLVWAGFSGHRNDHNRSTTLAQLLAPLPRDGLTFFSFQLGEAADQAKAFPEVIELSPLLTDFSASAALIQSLDLLISVDSAPVHLAGALGLPVALLLPMTADWRWHQSAGTSLLYPSVRIFQQHRLKDWSHPLSELATYLREPSKQNL